MGKYISTRASDAKTYYVWDGLMIDDDEDAMFSSFEGDLPRTQRLLARLAAESEQRFCFNHGGHQLFIGAF